MCCVKLNVLLELMLVWCWWLYLMMLFGGVIVADVVMLVGV